MSSYGEAKIQVAKELTLAALEKVSIGSLTTKGSANEVAEKVSDMYEIIFKKVDEVC
ncbi:hypothetical protein [Effusibacillus dendaii]|uniref:Uncharacterized protein n=1 Tax=Effusibacillus dendaii TaxID=2743772 RepID=A0A7I8DF15_9BACL|nr:hypothetical protein [Effusibacillus dendaii]BCJ86501.1 hypothetical protein skT53_14860 [Effusibacillus dendaii]